MRMLSSHATQATVAPARRPFPHHQCLKQLVLVLVLLTANAHVSQFFSAAATDQSATVSVDSNGQLVFGNGNTTLSLQALGNLVSGLASLTSALQSTNNRLDSALSALSSTQAALSTSQAELSSQLLLQRAQIAGVNTTLQTTRARVVQQVFTSNGVYVPTPGMSYAIVELVGGGGGSGGAGATTGTTYAAGTGGGGGGYARKYVTFAQVSQNVSITVGAGGLAGAATGGVYAGPGGPTQFGTIFSATGGGGGLCSGGTGSATVVGVTGGAGIGGDVNIQGEPSPAIIFSFPAGNCVSGGNGGSSVLGGGGLGGANPSPGGNYGGGAGAGYNYLNSVAKVGAAGAPGVAIIREYINMV